ncbi:hypothetical protein GCM10009425_45300 [Pseudomonas asuensis]|uniref:DUF1090 domain-containing protein n=1 Tax=Pseudomonas asuensis TaxID=1825787 RepID=A0ABQ2H3S9_9PSED|nr:DUF1090 domain-containing protein [Pseudomonas asuensis]GGM29695.1 hypothetical protein GCM10009425_45300 [Pseudomonas asuensis]
MRYAIAALYLLLTMSLAEAQNCSEKENKIQRQLDHAREHGNDSRIRGLETALRSVRNNCTDAGLQAKRQQKISKARKEVNERKADLQEVINSSSAETINKRRRKLAEAQQELRDAIKE